MCNFCQKGYGVYTPPQKKKQILCLSYQQMQRSEMEEKHQISHTQYGDMKKKLCMCMCAHFSVVCIFQFPFFFFFGLAVFCGSFSHFSTFRFIIIVQLKSLSLSLSLSLTQLVLSGAPSGVSQRSSSVIYGPFGLRKAAPSTIRFCTESELSRL